MSGGSRPPAAPGSIRSQERLGHYPYSELAAVLLFLGTVIGVFGSAAVLLIAGDSLAFVPEAVRTAVLLTAAAGALCVAQGILIEPYRLTRRNVRITSSKIPDPLRLVFLTDTHVRSWGRMERALVDAVRRLKPDAVLMGGDYASFPAAAPAVRRLMTELASLAPTYGSRGNYELRKGGGADFFKDTGAVLLAGRGETLRVRGSTLSIFGADPGEEDVLRSLGKTASPGAFSIGLYHYADMCPETASLPYDLLLSGHTHGGQIRLPLVGALFSSSRAGREYARGVFRFGDKTACVSQGIGCIAHGLPKMRFFCPPEIVVLELGP